MTTKQKPYKKVLKEYTQVLRKKLYYKALPIQEVDLIKNKYLAKLESIMPNNSSKSFNFSFNKVIFEIRTMNIELSSANQRLARKYPGISTPHN